MDNQQPTDYQTQSTTHSQPQSILQNLKFWQLSTFALGLTLIVILGVYFYTNSRQPPPQPASQPIPAVIISPSPTMTQILPTATPIQVDETGDWKTYTNKEFGYSFKYPLDWIFKDAKVAPDQWFETVGGVAFIPKDGKEFQNDIIITSELAAIDMNDRDALKNYINKYHMLIKEGDIEYKEIKISSTSGIKGSYIQGGAMPSETTFIRSVATHKGRRFYITTMYEANLSLQKEGDIRRLDTYNQILSTFKFLD